ncbi:MAG: 4Fe-4S binding protein, partial [Chloroflexota bacterium]
MIAHPASPLGMVLVRREGCTLCGACAEVCPTGALALADEGASLTLTFDPRRCTACQLCVPRCPEGPAVLRVEQRTRARDLVAGRVALHRDEQER